MLEDRGKNRPIWRGFWAKPMSTDERKNGSQNEL